MPLTVFGASHSSHRYLSDDLSDDTPPPYCTLITVLRVLYSRSASDLADHSCHVMLPSCTRSRGASESAIQLLGSREVDRYPGSRDAAPFGAFRIRYVFRPLLRMRARTLWRPPSHLDLFPEIYWSLLWSPPHVLEHVRATVWPSITLPVRMWPTQALGAPGVPQPDWPERLLCFARLSF